MIRNEIALVRGPTVDVLPLLKSRLRSRGCPKDRNDAIAASTAAMEKQAERRANAAIASPFCARGGAW
jgi:hypothetical protein